MTATARTEAQLTFGTAGACSLELRSDNSSNETVSFSISATTGADGLSNAVSAINENRRRRALLRSSTALVRRDSEQHLGQQHPGG